MKDSQVWIYSMGNLGTYPGRQIFCELICKYAEETINTDYFLSGYFIHNMFVVAFYWCFEPNLSYSYNANYETI